MKISYISSCYNNCLYTRDVQQKLYHNLEYGFRLTFDYCETKNLIPKLDKQSYKKLIDEGIAKMTFWWFDSECKLYQDILQDFITQSQHFTFYNPELKQMVTPPVYDKPRSETLQKIYSDYNMIMKLGSSITVCNIFI
jgi:hypothetical protein